MRKKYENYLNQYTKTLTNKEKQSRILGYIKLLLAALLIVVLWLSIQYGFDNVKWIVLFGIVSVSIVFWVQHSRVCRYIGYLKGLTAVVDRYLARIDGDWVKFADDGAEYADYNHPYAIDLDIYGPKSIFQFLNVANTQHGRLRFQKDLAAPKYSSADIKNRQEAIQELSELDDFSHDFQYYSSLIEDRENISALMEKLKQKSGLIKNERLKEVLKFMPLLFYPVALGIFVFRFSPLYLVAVILIAVQMLTWILFAFKTYKYLSSIDKIRYDLEKYSVLYGLLEKQKFKSGLLKELQANVASSDDSAAEAIKQLDKIFQRVKMRGNAILYFLLNVFLLWDINCTFALDKWKEDYSPYFDKWFSSLGELESLLCFSVIGNVVSGMVFPDIAPNEKCIRARGIGHPLIPNNKRVCNNFDLDHNITVISGSNMSGKTTFLRTIGLNLVLAKCGCSVCAESMSFSDMEIITSMRISDDLNEGVSTFYAELKKIKAIISLAAEKQNVIFFIDEIFKGTNSLDRIAGAKAVISRLYELRACGFLTTHDLTLCEYTDGTRVSNWHFSEHYIDGKLLFDYKIKQGIAKTTNGRYLMRMLGIVN